MKKKLTLAILVVMCMVLLAISASAAPTKPDIGVEFGDVSTIDGFTPPSQLYVETDERVLLTDGNGAYVTYPTYYITKDSTTFDVNFNSLNGAQSVQYTKASIVMLEVPDGITTLSNSYFAGGNFSSCKYVQIPGSVTSYGSSLFSTNNAAKIVEFLDGTQPVTMGDAMFGGNWNSGSVVQYVKFPNNLVSIGNNTFGKNKVSKTVIFGENLATIGTGFFGESSPSGCDTFLYISDKFFEDTSTVFTNLFGNYAQYHGNQLRLTIFYTGSKEKAQAFVDACAAIQSGYVFNNVTFVSADDYVYDTHKPTQDLSATIVYDYNKCDAFYNGEHKEKESPDTNPCVLSECAVCGVKNIYTGNESTHSMVETITYESFLANGTKTIKCAHEGCQMEAIVDNSLEAIYKFNGYSAKIGGNKITVGYTVNQDALAVYTEKNGALVYGVVAYVPEDENDMAPFENGYTLKNPDRTILAEINANEYTGFNFILNGFDSTTYDIEVIMCAYVYDGEAVYYLGNEQSTTAPLVSFNGEAEE